MVLVQSSFSDAPPILKPEAVLQYTTNMGRVDCSDHFISNYKFERRSKKWYRKMFFLALGRSSNKCLHFV